MKRNTLSGSIKLKSKNSKIQSLQVLMVEDSEDDALLIIRDLKKGGYNPVYERVETAAAMKKALQEKQWDIILCDYKMPKLNAPSAIAILKEANIDIPLIVVTGAIGEQTAVDCMRLGAQDCVMKDNLSRLCPAIARELEEAKVRNRERQTEKALREGEELYRTIFESTGTSMILIEEDMTISMANEEFVRNAGYSADEIIGRMKWTEIIHPDDLERMIEQHWLRRESHGGALSSYEFRYITKTGDLRDTLLTIKLVPGTKKSIASLIDITERKKSDKAIKNSELKYRNIFENAVEGIYQSTIEGRFMTANASLARMAGYNSPEELMESVKDIGTQLYVHAEDRERFMEIRDAKGFVDGFEVEFYKKDGSTFWVVINARTVKDEQGKILYFEGLIEDITVRKQAEEKLQQTLGSLRNAIGVTIKVLVSAVGVRDPYTAGHQIRSADLARAIATEMGLCQDKIEGIRIAGSIHDIGKLSIPAEILSKPTRLTEIEFSLIKEHSQSGYDMLKNMESPWPLAQIVYQHHERMNGSGYPRNLKGDEIIIDARIMAVADVVEAMASHRPYRPALGIDSALEEIEQNKGIIYDDIVADACLKLFREKGYQLHT